MSRPVTIALIGEPQGKGRGRVGKLHNGRPVVFTPTATRKYEAALRVAASDAMVGRVLFEGPVEVVVLAEFPPPASWSRRKQEQAIRGEIWPTKKPDADNLLKVLDALNTVVWRDDVQVVTATIRKRYAARAALTITAREIEPVQPSLLNQSDIFARARRQAVGQGRPAQ